MPQIWDLPELTTFATGDVILAGKLSNKNLCKANVVALGGDSIEIPFTFNSNLTITLAPINGDPSYTLSSVPFTAVSLNPFVTLVYANIEGTLTFTSSRSGRYPPLSFAPNTPTTLKGLPLFFSWDTYSGFTSSKSPVVVVQDNTVAIAERTYYYEDTSGATSIATASYGNNVVLQNPKIAAIIFAKLSDFS